MSKLPALASVFALTFATAQTATAAEDDAAAGGSLSLSSEDGVKSESSSKKPDKKAKSSKKSKKSKKGSQSGTPFMKRFMPERNMLEVGIFGGILLPSAQHELYDPKNSWQRYKNIAPDIGLRVAFYPLSFLGAEVEGAIMPTKTVDDVSAMLFGFRGHLIAQFPRRIAPFVLGGIGALGTSGDSLGKDFDLAMHFGGGVKFFINRYLMVRLDVRDNVSAAVSVDNGRTNHIEILLGLSATLGRKKGDDKPLIDTDGDGLYDAGQDGVRKKDEDRCKLEPGPKSNQGCPLKDSDGDGLWDPGQGAPADETDKCPDEPGPQMNQGCPLIDSDGDGFWDPDQGAPAEQEDACPNEAGPSETQGCPIKDSDGDGLPDPGQGQSPEDQCPQEPETFNEYQDEDGCADKVPDAVKKFTGAIRGINFDVDKDTIKKNSSKTLKAAIKVLKDFPDVRIEISGHTDPDGGRDHNLDLSRRRAESVKKYLVDHGIDASRIETRGAGPDEPIADNKTRRGKAKNRRIEFKLLKGKLSSE
ncbi:MAG TPA: OmpA family protein [Nannocystis exedens]|nr:OmpA family protein [Nannocystis exedens]